MWDDVGGTTAGSLLTFLDKSDNQLDFLTHLAGPRREQAGGFYQLFRSLFPPPRRQFPLPNFTPLGRMPRITNLKPTGRPGPATASSGVGSGVGSVAGSGNRAASDDPLIDHSSREAFIASMMPFALLAEARTGIPAEIMLAINLNEQGWQHPAPGNNYFGIKAGPGWTGPTTGPVATWEDYGDGRVNTAGVFRAYPSPAESYEDFANFLRENSRYAGALKVLEETGDGEAFIRAVHAAGYATDPMWADKIISIARLLRPPRLSEAEREWVAAALEDME